MELAETRISACEKSDEFAFESEGPVHKDFSLCSHLDSHQATPNNSINCRQKKAAAKRATGIAAFEAKRAALPIAIRS